MVVRPGFGWKNLQDHVRWAGLSQYHRRTLSQVFRLLSHIVVHTSAPVRMLFVYQMQLAISSMNAWQDLEALVFQTCRRYPVSAYLVSGIQTIELRSLENFRVGFVTGILGNLYCQVPVIV